MMDRKEYQRHYQRKWAKANRDKTRAYAKSWRLRHPNYHSERCRKWKAAHPEKLITSYAAAKEQGRAYGKKDANGDIYDSCRESRRKWHQQNPEKKRAHLRVLRAVKKGILRKQPCWCGETKVHAHHPNGYEASLDVVWLCPAHHREIHRTESSR